MLKPSALPSQFLMVLAFLLLPGTRVSAQLIGVTPDTSTPGSPNGVAYMQGDVDTINPVDGSLSVRINIPLPKGRGLSIPFSIGYDSNSKWHPMGGEVAQYAPVEVIPGSGTTVPGTSDPTYLSEYLTWAWENSFLALNGWSYTAPVLTVTKAHQYWQFQTFVSVPASAIQDCPYWTGYTFSDTAGGRQQLHLMRGLPSTSADGSNVTSSCPTENYTESYGSSLTAGTAVNVPTYEASVADLRGTVYRFPRPTYNSRGATSDTWNSLADLVEDRNGNRISIQGTDQGALSYQDTLGRTLLNASGFGHEGDTIAVSGVQNSYVLHWSTIHITGFSTNTRIFILGDANPSDAQKFCGGLADVTPQDLTVLTSIDLPNGTHYQFAYDQTYGLLNQVTLPGGGWVQYTWTNNPLASTIPYEHLQMQNHWLPGTVADAPGPGCIANYDKWAVHTRKVSFDGTNVARQDTFTYATSYANNVGNNSFWSGKTTTVASSDLISGRSNTTTHSYVAGDAYSIPARVPTGYIDPVPVEVSTTTTGDLSESESITRSWQALADTPAPYCEQRNLDGAFASMRAMSYSSGTILPSEVDEYGGGSCSSSYSSLPSQVSGSVIRRTINALSFLSAPAILPNATIVVPSSVKITGSDANTAASETDYGYDETAVVAATASGHDDDCFAAARPNNTAVQIQTSQHPRGPSPEET